MMVVEKRPSLKSISDWFEKRSRGLYSRQLLVIPRQIISKCKAKVSSSLIGDRWISLFPGKELLERSATKLGVKQPISLQNSIIKEFAKTPTLIDQELRDVFRKIFKTT
jgi:hypothetical protein